MIKSELEGKICVPVVGRHRAEIGLMVEEAIASGADMIEWRADYYPFQVLSEVEGLLSLIQSRIGNCPLIVTYRSISEGGNGAANVKMYTRFCEVVVTHPAVTYLDVEWEQWYFVAKQSSIRDNLDKIILSKHESTPGIDEKRLHKNIQQMQTVCPAIMKLAVTPKDVKQGKALERLRKTYTFPNQVNSSVLLLIGMGEWGRNLRILGHRWGNPWTFASLSSETASAPGQLTVSELQEIWQDKRGDADEKEKTSC
ncbi:type I 3-dehydroquinate dehydratase [Vagococcus lutrae]|uniref:type I 3-dehydroquinate dehydratase n=1 Tax=Vagococcus lutrae TaxID=81947 RepID=UPI002096CBA8|nr:type I 3-dehydroquinate dehydratase [Vagococcus lutrae]MCO7151063.1 type I 3-dehydroquinate dehydratase [Vagococcus lutrae]MDT2802076.1 type I 3-dehydroquinate dehydratase [Vagococcus lutrae]MDT2826266.1 type I 3-dehydroquinate dehydratase [Vagococcus lutrae]